MKGLVWSGTKHIMLACREGERSEVDRAEFGVARNEAYGLMCQAIKVVYEDTEEPYEVVVTGFKHLRAYCYTF